MKTTHILLPFALCLCAIPAAAVTSATFVGTDTATQGSWRMAYGRDGYHIIGDVAGYPGYVTVTPSGNVPYTWMASTGETRALQKFSSPNDRIAAAWYSYDPGVFSVDLNFTDQNVHKVAFYVLDWDTVNVRAEQIDVLDAANNNLLDSRGATSFTAGKYFVWNLSGHV